MFHSVSCGYLFNESRYMICLRFPLSVFLFHPTVMNEKRFLLHLIKNYFNTRAGCSSVGDQPGKRRVVGWSPRWWHNLETFTIRRPQILLEVLLNTGQVFAVKDTQVDTRCPSCLCPLTETGLCMQRAPALMSSVAILLFFCHVRKVTCQMSFWWFRWWRWTRKGTHLCSIQTFSVSSISERSIRVCSIVCWVFWASGFSTLSAIRKQQWHVKHFLFSTI